MVIVSAILGAVTLALLPVFYRLCPYQSPTGWAFVQLSAWFCAAPWRLARWTSTVLPSFFDLIGADSAWSYNLWYRSTIHLLNTPRLENWRTYNLHSVEDPRLCRPLVRGIKEASDEMGHGGQADYNSVDAVQTRVLTRALSWVRRGSSDDRVLNVIVECLQTVHSQNAPMTPTRDNLYFLSSMHTICTADVYSLCTMAQSLFLQMSQGSLSFRTGPYRLEDRFGPFVDVRSYDQIEQEYLAVCDAWETNAVSLEICRALICCELRSLVRDWALFATNSRTQKVVGYRIAVLLCVLRIAPSANNHTALALDHSQLTNTELLARTLEELYRTLASHGAAYTDGLVPMCVQLCRMCGPVTFELVQGKPNVTGTCPVISPERVKC